MSENLYKDTAEMLLKLCGDCKEYDPRKGQCRYPGCAARTFKVFCENHGGPDPEELTTALEQLEKAKADINRILVASGQDKPHCNVDTIIEGICHMRLLIDSQRVDISKYESLQDQLEKAKKALRPKCTEGKHSLISIYSEPGDDNHAVVRWCEQCGAVVIDEDMDGRTSAGKLLSMQFPELRRLAASTLKELEK
jgi:hypothetical protein